MKIKKIPHSSFYLIQDRVHLKWLMLLKPKLGFIIYHLSCDEKKLTQVLYTFISIYSYSMYIELLNSI